MTAKLIDGAAVAARIIESVRQRVNEMRAQGLAVPGLAVVLVGDDPASRLYVGNKRKACDRAGFYSREHKLPEDVRQEHLLELIESLNNDPAINGILVQLPLPEHIDARKVTEQMLAEKDVDGFHPTNIGNLVLRCPVLSPCTPKGIMRLLFEYDIPIRGRHTVVVGASNIVGRPMALEFLQAGATVTCCHRFTQDLPEMLALGDIIVVAVGKPGVVQGKWINEGSVVIDVGINRMDDGRLQGDVDFAAASERAAWITPVPGGVGPMTVATLMVNTLRAAGQELWQTDSNGMFVA